jgi:hypothetical protein
LQVSLVYTAKQNPCIYQAILSAWLFFQMTRSIETGTLPHSLTTPPPPTHTLEYRTRCQRNWRT